MMKIASILKKKHRGGYLPLILISSVLFIALAYSVLSLAMGNVKIYQHHRSMVSAIDIADAGINYYMWHLSHDNKDYCDGQVCPGTSPYGPYIHEYKDQAGNVLGSYELTITPPAAGDAAVEVKAVGKLATSSETRTVIAKVGMPSFARYAFLTNTEAWFAENETTHGPVHSNTGVHFDGVADGPVTSSSGKVSVDGQSGGYIPGASFGGDGARHDGVWGSGGPTGYWVFPVPIVDFNQITVDIAKLEIAAASDGIHLNASGDLGYYLNLKNNNTIDVYRVTRERTTGINTTFIENRNAPVNGILYAADNLWIDGTYGQPITIVSQKSSSTGTIKIKNNLTYTTKNGSVQIGLIAVSNIEIPDYAANDLEIDGALISQKGHIYFPNPNGPLKNQITIYGSIGSFDWWTWNWLTGNSVTAGYATTSQTFDTYLTLSPPPQFPTTGSYNVLSWREE